MARTATVLLAFLTLSSLRSTTGRSLGNKGGSNRAWTAELGRGAAVGGRVASRGRADSFVFADGRRLGDEPACPTDCVKCSSIGECLQCTNAKYLNPLVWTCEEICPEGFHPEGTGASNRTCTPCAADCAKCNSASECVYCKNNKYLSPAGACGFGCPPGYQTHGDDVTGRTCWPCPPRCRTCTDWYTCDVCETGAYLLPNRTCLEVCDHGYFRDDSGAMAETGGVCTECYETCSKCTGRATCQECQQSTYLSRLDHMCRATCEDGYYQKGLAEVGNTCEACPSSCALCTSPERCSVCNEGYFLTPNETCDETCPDGYYGNSTWGTCESCPNSCDRCSDANTCTDCMKSKTLTAAGTCEFVCPEGFYKNGTGTIGDSCQPCPSGCARCIAGMFSPVVCLECGDYNYLTHRGECTKNCPEGYYPQDGNGPLGGVCVPCDPTCVACLSAKECTKCQVLHFLTPQAACELNCPRGWTEQGGMDLKEPGTCVLCPDNCGSCQSLQVCEECNNFFYLHQGVCMKSCPLHYYEVEVPKWQAEGRFCRSCRVNDYACSSPNAKVGIDPDQSLTIIAESCQNDYYLYDGACHPKALCPVGTFPRRGMDGAQAPGNYIGGECVDCPENCYSCSSPQRCTVCKHNTYLGPDMACMSVCPTGFFEVGTAETGRSCQPCSANCGECQSSQFCTKCIGGAFLTADFTCEAQCPDGFYPRNPPDGSTEGRTCEKCLGDCLTCETRYSCTECKNSAYLTHEKECRPECPPTHYPDGSESEEGRYCVECPGSCSECSGPYNCTQCKTPTFLTAHGTCDSSCQEGYYSEAGRDVHTYWGLKVGGTCNSCPENCNRCLGSGCLECNKFTYLDANGECVERCPDGYFGSGTDELGRVCSPCSASHGVCLNSTYVLECGDNTYLDPWNLTCLGSCPNGYFGLEGEAKEENGPKIGGTCEKCLGSCKTCSSSTVCQVCWNGYYLNPRTGRCTMVCPRDHYMSGTGPDGYYKSPGIAEYEGGPMIGGTCRKCVNNCKTCYSVNHCTSCRSGAYFNARDEKCDFSCPEDMYMSGDGEEGRECKQCPAKFHTCINEERASHCKGDNLYLTSKGECVSTCPVGSWRRTSNFTASNGMLVGGTCELCVGDCRECLTNKECTVCENKMLLRNGTCEAKCPDGFWEKTGKNGVNGTCEHCSIGTKKCTAPQKAALISSLIDLGDGAAEPQAIECDPGVELKNGECVNPCPSGKYKDPESDKCVSCPGNCTTCMTADKCTECGPGAYLDKSLLPNVSVCRPECPDGFYTNGREGANGGRCLACSTSCLQCSDRDQCLLCKDMRYLAQDISSGAVTCEDTCPDGFYPNGTKAIGRTCPMCGQNCKTCLSAGQCALCTNGKYLIADGWCEDGCPDGYYRKGDGDTGRTCEMCPGDFFTCVSDKIGTECQNRKYLTASGTCESTCPDGTYHVGSGDLGRHCLPCGQNCASCLEGDLCLQCTDSRYLSPDGWCEASCPDGYYKNGTAITGRNCAACPTNAMSCLNPSETTECKNFKYLTAAGTCEDACPEGTYPEGRGAVGRSCQVCHGNCEICTQANACQRCKNGLYLSRDQWCEVSCPDGYFRNGTEDVGRSCLRCPDSAMKCIGPALITECRDWLYLTPDGTCSSSCPEGTYPHGANSVGRRCESCVNDCVHCTRDNVCLQCRNSKYLTPDFWCEATCPPGSWKNYSGAVGSRCETCPGDFGACITPVYATECKNSKYLTHEATCQDACPNGYFPKGNGDVGRHCPQCHDDCYSCSTSNLCTVCDNGKFLSPNMWCDETCPDGYYRNGTAKIGNTCPQCPKHASKCINGTHTIECKDSRYLNPDFTCEVDCPRGMYQNGVTSVGRVCSLCAENCTLCVNGTTCTECRNNRYLTPEFWCEEECPSDHYYKPAPSLQEIEWKKLPDQSCGGSRITTWSGGGDAQYGEQYVDNLAGCQLLCMARAECAGFELREDINRCSFWKAAPLSPKAAQGVHCYRKMRLAPKKSSSPASEVVLPAWGKASMSSSLETTLPSHCNDGLVATRCSSMWNEAAGELTPWWQMDLEDSETIVKIRILSDPDGCEALSDEDTGLHCSILGGVVGVSDTPCAAGKNCSGTVCGTLKEAGDDKWFEIDCDRASGQYVYLQLPGYRVLNFRELVAYKVAESESCVETWQTTNVFQTGDTFAAANQEGGASFAVAGPVASVSFKPGQDDRPVWVGLTTDPTDERDYQDGKYIHLTPKGSIAIDGASPSMTYTTEDYFRLELKGKELIIFKSGAAIHTYDLGSSTSLHGWFALIWFGPTGTNEPAASIEQVQTSCVPPQEGVGGTCVKCPGHASRCVNGSIALECKNDMYLRRTHDCAPECPHGDYPTDGWYGVGGYCTQCHENCNTCVNATTCLECKNQHYLTHDFKCVPECAKGYYEVKGEKWDDGLGGSCKQCHENCSACNSDTECTECRLFTYRTDSATCTDACPDTYYKNGTEMIGGECLPCGENCFECESDVTCKVCNSSYFLARTGECVEHCPDGDYEVGDEEYGRQCMKCPDDFNKCITATYASECKNNLYLNADAECVTSCPEGYFQRPLHSKPVGNECPVCPGNCNKCEDASTCTECKNTMYLNPDFWCEPECPIGYYKVGNAEIGNTCAKCPANCRTCIDGETCTECTNFKYLTPNRDCVEVCPNNTFPQGEAETGRACPHCEKNCHICESATLCLQCNNSMHLDDMDNCVVTCPDGYYPEGAEDRGRTCESCPMSYCGICTGPDVCLECTESRYLNPDSTCKTECPDGFYRYGEEETGRICPRCFHTCNKCDSADICKECKNSTYLTPDSKCNYECPPGYYEHGTEEVGGLCKLCSDNCVECTGALVCEVCKNNYFLDPTSSTCKTSCPVGWYENIPDETVDTGRTCMQCPAPCNKCNSANECTECKDSAFLTPFGTCEYTCPPGLYPFGVGEINITCQPCSSNCDTCDTYEVCTACKNDKFLNPDGVCRDICPDGYWELPVWGGVGNSCPLCAENCSLCTSPTVCQECRNSTYLSHYHWCEEECQDGYYEQGVDDLGRVCKICPPTCNKCEAEDHCTECKFSTFLTHYQACETTCPPGYYPNRTRDVGGVCETCPDECTQCSTASTCSECRNGLYLTPNGWCEEACPEGHYALDGTGGVGGTCPMCPENCHACNSAEECTVCRGFTHLTEYNQCRSECPNGYYENGTDSIGGGCNRCPSPCNLCETANVCTECAEASYLTPTGACLYKCPDRYHFEGSEDIGRFCKACPPTCFNCLSQEQCTLCQNFTFLTPDEKCEYTCPDGTYRDGIKEIGNTCPFCPKDVKRCISDTYATECSNKKYLTPSATCDEGCPDGYYRHGDGEVGRTCPMCAQNCTVCTNATTCQGCKNGQYLTHTHWCDHECPDGYYKSGTGDQGRICKVCHSSCNTCLGPEVCTECKQGTYLAPDGSCKLDCPEGYYKLPGTEGVGGTCPICPLNCAECAAESQCTICANSTYLHDKQCKPRCPDGWYHMGEDAWNRECMPCTKGCSQCTEKGFCTECKDGLFLNPDATCASTCPDGFFQLPGEGGVGGVCQHCSENCTKCSWWDQCQECKSSRYLTHYHWCVEECPSGYYEEGTGEVGRLCMQCPETCNLCEGPAHCTECKNSTYLTALHQCKGECPLGFFHEGIRDVGRTCQACERNCHQCVSSTECLECKNSTFLTAEQDCAETCPPGYYGQGEQILGNTCQKCSKDCALCDALENCIECTNSTYLTSDKYCVEECTKGYIETGDTLSGRFCDELCFWCE